MADVVASFGKMFTQNLVTKKKKISNKLIF